MLPFVCMMNIFEIYSLSVFPVFSTNVFNLILPYFYSMLRLTFSYFKKNFYWSTIDLQCYISVRCTA